jgi:hypothetical protein
MLRIVDGIVFERKVVPGRYAVAVHELGHGQREATVSQCWQMVESEWDATTQQRYIDYCREKTPSKVELAERAAVALEKSKRRLRTRSRRLCKAIGADTLLTLTYRANQTDLALAKEHLDLFNKRMRKVIGRWVAKPLETGPGRSWRTGWAYVAFPEEQGRGAWHWHLGTRALPPELQRGGKVKSWNLVRAVWRSVVGDLGGNVDFSGGRRGGRRSAAKIAAYIAKYGSKACGGVTDGSRRFQASQVSLRPPTRVEFAAASMAELIELVYSFAADGPCEVVSSFVGPFGDSFYLASGPPRFDRSIHCQW